MTTTPQSIRSPIAAQIIKETRQVKGMTLKDLSEKTQLSEGYLSLIEREQRPLSRENFLKIFEAGFAYGSEPTDNLWRKLLLSAGDENIAIRTIASSKYRVRCLGFERIHDEENEQSYSIITTRWTVSGRIYIWKFYEGRTNSLIQKNPLTSEEHRSNWEAIYNTLGQGETLALLEAIVGELKKIYEEAESEREHNLFNYALPEIEDIRDALESLPENNQSARMMDIPF